MSRSLRRDPTREADDDAKYYERLRGKEERRRSTAALKLGAENIPDSQLPPGGITSRMSSADQNNAARRIQQVRGSASSLSDPTQVARARRNPAAEMAANTAVARSPVSLNVNTPNALAAGATAASALPRTPQAARFVAPAPLTGPNGNAASDAADLAQNLEFARNPSAFQPPRPAAPKMADPTQPQGASTGIGRTLTPAQGNALFGDPNLLSSTTRNTNGQVSGRSIETTFGNGSARMAGAGENNPDGTPKVAAVTTENGVSRGAPFNSSAARIALQKSHPNIFIAGTPENAAFVAHAKRYGEEAAHQAAPGLMATLTPQATGVTGQMAKNDLPNGDQAARVAQMAGTTASAQPPAPPSAAADVGRKVASGAGQAAGVVAGSLRSAVAPISALGTGVTNFHRGLVGAPPVADPMAKPRMADPTQQPTPSIAAPPSAPAPVAETPEEKERKKRMQSPI